MFEDRFLVELSFDNIPEKLCIPFDAIKGFFDPSVQFGLQFETGEANENAEAELPVATRRPPSQAKVAGAGPEQPADRQTETVASDPDPGGAKVVRLDSFRKS